MAITTATGLEIDQNVAADFIPIVWSDDVLDAMQFEMVLETLVTTKYENELTVGQTIKIPHVSNLLHQSGAAGTILGSGANTTYTYPINFQAVKQTSDTITVDQFYYSSILVNRTVANLAKYDLRKLYTDKMGYALQRGIETYIAALFSGFSSSVGTLGSALTDANIRTAWSLLGAAGYYDDCAWVFSPQSASDLFGIDRYANTQYIPGQRTIERAQLPTLYGFPAVMSNLLTVDGTSGGHYNAVFNKTAIALVRQTKPTTEVQYRIEWNGDAVLSYVYFTAKEMGNPKEAPLSGTGAGSTEGATNYGDQAGVVVLGR